MPRSKGRREKPRPRPSAAKSTSAASGVFLNIRGKEHFEEAVLDSDLPVIVDFWAPWCVPCRMMAPVFEQVAGNWVGRVRFAKLDTEAVPSVAQAFHVASIPTLLVLYQGEVVDVNVGVTAATSLNSMAQRVYDRHLGLGFFDRLKRSLGFGKSGQATR